MRKVGEEKKNTVALYETVTPLIQPPAQRKQRKVPLNSDIMVKLGILSPKKELEKKVSGYVASIESNANRLAGIPKEMHDEIQSITRRMNERKEYLEHDIKVLTTQKEEASKLLEKADDTFPELKLKENKNIARISLTTDSVIVQTKYLYGVPPAPFDKVKIPLGVFSIRLTRSWSGIQVGVKPHTFVQHPFLQGMGTGYTKICMGQRNEEYNSVHNKKDIAGIIGIILQNLTALDSTAGYHRLSTFLVKNMQLHGMKFEEEEKIKEYIQSGKRYGINLFNTDANYGVYHYDHIQSNMQPELVESCGHTFLRVYTLRGAILLPLLPMFIFGYGKECTAPLGIQGVDEQVQTINDGEDDEEECNECHSVPCECSNF